MHKFEFIFLLVISLSYNDKRYVWGSKGEALKPKNTVPAAKHGGGSIMLRGCFAVRRTGILHEVK